jgi:hypothetical protein
MKLIFQKNGPDYQGNSNPTYTVFDYETNTVLSKDVLLINRYDGSFDLYSNDNQSLNLQGIMIQGREGLTDTVYSNVNPGITIIPTGDAPTPPVPPPPPPPPKYLIITGPTELASGETAFFTVNTPGVNFYMTDPYGTNSVMTIENGQAKVIAGEPKGYFVLTATKDGWEAANIQCMVIAP